jgi:hypothetical protein
MAIARSFVTGHDFSRAEIGSKMWGFCPWGLLFRYPNAIDVANSRQSVFSLV